MNFVGYFSKTFWVFYGCFRWVLFYQVGGFLVGLCKGLPINKIDVFMVYILISWIKNILFVETFVPSVCFCYMFWLHFATMRPLNLKNFFKKNLKPNFSPYFSHQTPLSSHFLSIFLKINKKTVQFHHVIPVWAFESIILKPLTIVILRVWVFACKKLKNKNSNP